MRRTGHHSTCRIFPTVEAYITASQLPLTALRFAEKRKSGCCWELARLVEETHGIWNGEEDALAWRAGWRGYRGGGMVFSWHGRYFAHYRSERHWLRGASQGCGDKDGSPWAGCVTAMRQALNDMYRHRWADRLIGEGKSIMRPCCGL